MLKGTVLKFAAASLILFGATSLQAQETTSEKASCSKTCTKGEGMKKQMKEKKKQAFIESLSEEQKANYASMKEQKDASRTSMEASFSAEQLAIVNNKELDKKAKREALKTTFTDAQKEQSKANRLAGKNAKDAFVATLSDEQKELMPKGRHGKGKKGGKKGHQERKG